MTRLIKIRTLIREELSDICQAIRHGRSADLIQDMIEEFHAAISVAGSVEPDDQRPELLTEYSRLYEKFKEGTCDR